jgi:hypothetical protein
MKGAKICTFFIFKIRGLVLSSEIHETSNCSNCKYSKNTKYIRFHNDYDLTREEVFELVCSINNNIIVDNSKICSKYLKNKESE